jgi:hypothetical protein
VPAKPVPDRERFVEQRRRRGAPGRELAADLDQGERVSLCPGCDVPRDLPVQRDVARGAEQNLRRVIEAEGLDGQFGDTAEGAGFGPTFAHAVTKRLLRYALDHGSRQADRYLLDVAPDLLESRDMQYAVGLLLTQGARKFIQNHAEVIFGGR